MGYLSSFKQPCSLFMHLAWAVLIERVVFWLAHPIRRSKSSYDRKVKWYIHITALLCFYTDYKETIWCNLFVKEHFGNSQNVATSPSPCVCLFPCNLKCFFDRHQTHQMKQKSLNILGRSWGMLPNREMINSGQHAPWTPFSWILPRQRRKDVFGF